MKTCAQHITCAICGQLPTVWAASFCGVCRCVGDHQVPCVPCGICIAGVHCMAEWHGGPPSVQTRIWLLSYCQN